MSGVWPLNGQFISAWSRSHATTEKLGHSDHEMACVPLGRPMVRAGCWKVIDLLFFSPFRLFYCDVLTLQLSYLCTRHHFARTCWSVSPGLLM